MSNEKFPKTYLGDSIYTEWDGYAITLTTENGVPEDPSNMIVLEPEQVRALVQFIKANSHEHMD